MTLSLGRRAAAVLLALVAAMSATAPADAAPSRAAEPATQSYIVSVRDSVDARQVARGLRSAPGLTVARTFSRTLPAFVVDATPAAARRLRMDRRVVRVEADRPVRATTVQQSATWGLDRVDQRALPLSGTYGYAVTGAGVDVYVIDSGIRPHAQFATRLVPGFTSVDDGLGTDDCNGHGTHVAGTVGGTVHGVAKQATLVPVRVLGCDGRGMVSGVIAGIDWMLRHRDGPAVANLSLSGSASSSLDDAVRRAVAAGVTVVVAAGNDNSDACTRSPARVAEALTVAATDRTDTRASFSNHGRCVDLFAPGVSIVSTGIGSWTATAVHSGTSMAAPHVAGAAALAYASSARSTATVSSTLVGSATAGVVRSAGTGSPDALLYTGALTAPTDPGATPPPNVAPTAVAATKCSGTTCTFDASRSTDADGTVASHRWAFSDGRTGTGAVVTRTFSRAGTVTGTVTVTDAQGATATATASVTCGRQGKGRSKTLSCATSTTTSHQDGGGARKNT